MLTSLFKLTSSANNNDNNDNDDEDVFISTTSSAENDNDVDDVVVWIGSRRLETTRTSVLDDVLTGFKLLSYRV